VARVVNALQEEDKHHQPISWLWFVGIVILSMVIGSLWPLWSYSIKYCFIYIRKRMLTPTPETTTSQDSNNCGTELQVRPRSTQTTLVNETTDASSLQLTEFLRHGVVTTDCQ